MATSSSNLSRMVQLAFRSLARNRRRSVITLGAVALGVAIATFTHGFGQGFVNMMLQQAVEERIGALQIHKKGYLQASEAAPLKLDIENVDALLQKVTAVPGVAAASPRLKFGALISNGKTSSIIFGEGLDAVRERDVCPGRARNVSDMGGVVGAELAKALDAKEGSVLTLSASGREGAVNALDLDVAGVAHGAISIIESKRSVVIPLAKAQELLQMKGRVTEIAVRVDHLDDARVKEVQAALVQALGPEYEVSSWDEVVPFLRDAMHRLHIVLNGISAVLFFIVVFGVINTMLMNVYERVKEIGTLLALGVRRRQVLALFLLEAWAIGLVGGAAGVVIGLVATLVTGAVGISFTPPGSDAHLLLHPVPRLDIAILALVVAMLGALVAAAYPARKASRMNPVEALRTN